MDEVLARWRCLGDDGTRLVVVERRHIRSVQGGTGPRRQIGARRLELEDGTAVRYIDAETFEVIASGEILRRLD
ncbi:MAG TPA: hypothetical protein VFT56_12600 [Sphingomonas sp.]|nr:hypothetical protein [Sphingomonas sp.]